MNSVNAPFNNPSTFDQNAHNPPFGQSINPTNLDLLQFGDGNNTPSHSQTPFQVPPVVPAKRGRPGEDATASPRQLGPSRSQTPQQFNQYGGSSQPPYQQTTSPFPQMSHHGSPSPGPQNRPNFPGQQMAQFGGQMPNQMNRMGTPQQQPQQMMRPGMESNGMNSPFPNAQGQGPVNTQAMENMRRQYQAQLARHQQQHGQNNPGGAPFMMNGQPGFRPGMGQGQGPGQQQNVDAEKQHEMQFIKSLRHFNEQKNKTINLNPRVAGHPVSFFRLFKHYARVNPAANQQSWQALAASMGIPNAQSNPAVAQELRNLFDSDLKDFYIMYAKAMRERQNRTGQTPQMPMAGSPTPRNSDGLPMPLGPQASSPGLPRQSGPNMHRPNASQTSNSTDLAAASNAGSVAVPGATPGAVPGAGVNGRPKSASLFSNLGTPDPPEGLAGVTTKAETPVATLSKPSADNVFDPQYQPRRRTLTKYGGLDIDALADLGGKVGDLKIYPRFEELGTTDLHVLNMCLLSGFRAEARYALDRMCALSQTSLRLWECEDLLDSIVHYGQIQVHRMLGQDDCSVGATEIPNFHDILHAGAAESDAFVELNGFSDKAYEEDRAVDRLITVTTILRNLSFPLMEMQVTERELEANARILAGESVKDLIAGCIKCLDPKRCTTLKTARNVQDLMKDLVTLLSNISDTIELSSEEQARLFLDFLLAFTPAPKKRKSNTSLELTMYNPLKHHYMPCAVDSLAKLLARDDPNRTFYRAIFNADALAFQGTLDDLLVVKAFSLALAPIPDSIEGTFPIGPANHTATQRRPFLGQGMLAADILSSLMPQPAAFDYDVGDSTSLERILLSSRDGWAPRLLRLIPHLAVSDASMQPVRDRTTGQVIDPSRPFTNITQRGLSMVRRLAERADKAEREKHGRSKESILCGLIPAAQLEGVLLSAMSAPGFDVDTMKLFGALAAMAR